MIQIDGMQGMIAAYIASPKGREMIHKFLTSPEGQKAVDNYLATPDGQQMGRLLLARALDGLDLPAHIKDQIRTALNTRGN